MPRLFEGWQRILDTSGRAGRLQLIFMTDPQQVSNTEARSSPSMSSSLLVRLTARDAEAWQRVVRLFYPLVRGWCLRAGLAEHDAADVAQEVFRALSGNIERFRREGGQNSFRGWLWGITKNQVRNYRRARQAAVAGVGGTEAQRRLAEVCAPGDSSASDADPTPDERQQVLRRALAMLRRDVEERTWQAFWRAVVEGHAPADIAADLGMTANAVYLIKARLLRRLRDEFGELLT